MCPDSLNWTLWVRFHGRYWYQSFIDGSNIWGVDRTDPWGPEMDHPPLGRSYLVVESSCFMAMLIVTWEISSSAAAKYELYILLPADQRCSKKMRCSAASWSLTFPGQDYYLMFNTRALDDLLCLDHLSIILSRGASSNELDVQFWFVNYKIDISGVIYIDLAFNSYSVGPWLLEAIPR